MAMIQKTVLLSLALLQSTGLASPVPHPNPSESKSCSPPGYGYGKNVGKAVYFITNEAENSVVALPISNDGTLSKGTITKTGGMGSNIINANSTMPNAPDALVSQSALTVVGNHIFAVNAGSNTLTMLTISPSDPTSLKILGEPVALPGTFPNTVTASMKHKLACVGTTGDKSGISCAPFSEKGLGEMDELRSFDLMQTSPPRGPPNTVSHTFFSADESMLFTTVKGNANTNSTGFFSVFAVETGDEGKAYVAKKDTRSSPAGTRTLFGSAVIPENPKSFFVTDPSFGAAIMSVDENMKVSVTYNQTIPEQQAICWSTFSTATKTAFLADGGKDRITELSMEDGSVVGQVDLPQVGGQGVFDIRAGGDFVYALSAGNGSVEAAISVVDVSGGKGSLRALQHFGLGGLATKNAMGMAVLV